MEREQTNLPLCKDIKDLANKLPEEVRANYKINRKASSTIEHLKVAAALKLWDARGYRDIKFDVPMTFGGKKLFIKVLARNAEGVVCVECASSVRLKWLHGRIAQLRSCLHTSRLILVFPSSAGERVKKTAKLADEVWTTGKNNTIEQIIFLSVFHKE